MSQIVVPDKDAAKREAALADANIRLCYEGLGAPRPLAVAWPHADHYAKLSRCERCEP